MSKEKEFKPDSLGGCLVYIIAIVIFFIIGASTKNDGGNTPTVQETTQQKQHRLNMINDSLVQMSKEGIIVDYKKPCYFYINERKWNALPFETKEIIIQNFLERYKLTDAPFVLIGYHSGEQIQDAKNFKGY